MSDKPFAQTLLMFLGMQKKKGASAEASVSRYQSMADSVPEIVSDEITIFAPITGKAATLIQVNDEAFSPKTLGKGAAIIPSEGNVYAPFDGTVTSVFETRNAIGLTSDSGVELLIHVGLNTDKLDGKYYNYHISAEDPVRLGQLILTFDLDKIQAEGYDVITPVVVTNTAAYKDIHAVSKTNLTALDPFINVAR